MLENFKKMLTLLSQLLSPPWGFYCPRGTQYYIGSPSSKWVMSKVAWGWIHKSLWRLGLQSWICPIKESLWALQQYACVVLCCSTGMQGFVLWTNWSVGVFAEEKHTSCNQIIGSQKHCIGMLGSLSVWNPVSMRWLQACQLLYWKCTISN